MAGSPVVSEDVQVLGVVSGSIVVESHTAFMDQDAANLFVELLQCCVEQKFLLVKYFQGMAPVELLAVAFEPVPPEELWTPDNDNNNDNAMLSVWLWIVLCVAVMLCCGACALYVGVRRYRLATTQALVMHNTSKSQHSSSLSPSKVLPLDFGDGPISPNDTVPMLANKPYGNDSPATTEALKDASCSNTQSHQVD
eukprot:CAMPEP_0196572020 /NCGR_PEP_ID=MMETSP1081-20130531/2146_1 /TAXON_ID=36882 /ORGANISM="Pyramimonas amylifera, Strain CCMP720" /LENGTH=195 /DNA_ID=CAMNT_0041889191 /DNA_START=15 /DNA_END=599 /DNA_ORIENTATION=-